jgi:hypothetical protein
MPGIGAAAPAKGVLQPFGRSVVSIQRCAMKKSGELRQRAERYRGLKRQIIDPRAVQAISELADEFETRAAALEKCYLVRKRAFEIWIERGCPDGRDVEHWLLAERELTGTDQPGRRVREHV